MVCNAEYGRPGHTLVKTSWARNGLKAIKRKLIPDELSRPQYNEVNRVRIRYVSTSTAITNRYPIFGTTLPVHLFVHANRGGGDRRLNFSCACKIYCVARFAIIVFHIRVERTNVQRDVCCSWGIKVVKRNVIGPLQKKKKTYSLLRSIGIPRLLFRRRNYLVLWPKRSFFNRRWPAVGSRPTWTGVLELCSTENERAHEGLCLGNNKGTNDLTSSK